MPPPRPNGPSGTGTTRIPTPRPEPAEPPTTRLSIAKNAVRNAVNNAATRVNLPLGGETQRTERPAPPPPREEREIESWLGELRGGPAGAPPPQQPSADVTRAMPKQRPRPGAPQQDDTTTAIPVQRPQDPDTTEKLNVGEREDDEHKRGGVSAQDLLRREGRI
jgi:RND superfamily putative drug exporter